MRVLAAPVDTARVRVCACVHVSTHQLAVVQHRVIGVERGVHGAALTIVRNESDQEDRKQAQPHEQHESLRHSNLTRGVHAARMPAAALIAAAAATTEEAACQKREKAPEKRDGDPNCNAFNVRTNLGELITLGIVCEIFHRWNPACKKTISRVSQEKCKEWWKAPTCLVPRSYQAAFSLYHASLNHKWNP